LNILSIALTAEELRSGVFELPFGDLGEGRRFIYTPFESA